LKRGRLPRLDSLPSGDLIRRHVLPNAWWPTGQPFRRLRNERQAPMLVLTRKPREHIITGGDIVLTVVEGSGGAVRIGIEAARGVEITRAEVLAAIIAENQAAVVTSPGAEEHLMAALGALTTPETPAGRRAWER
jgi:carbon storage regulator